MSPYHTIATIAGLLFIAIFPLPYGYYVFLKISVCFASLWLWKISPNVFRGQPVPLLWVFLAILFNPIVPIPFPKEYWMVIDALAGCIFAYAAYKIFSSEKREEPS